MSGLGRDYLAERDPPDDEWDTRVDGPKPPHNLLWHCADGITVPVRQMTEEHLNNAIKKFKRMASEGYIAGADPWDSDDALVPGSELEWKGRTIGEWLKILFAERKRRQKKEGQK